MKALAQTDPEVWIEFREGNWVVNKNTIPFCAIGPDHALEQVNRMMKVAGGLIGITLNPFARTKFFLAAPELARLAEEAKNMADLPKTKAKHHHELTEAKVEQQEKNAIDLKNTIEKFTNPFANGCNQLINMVTKAILPAKIQEDINKRTEIGEEKFGQFVSERIITNNVNLWAPMKKLNLQMWSSAGKKVTIKNGDKIMELKEDRALFARMLVVSKARDIDLKQVVGTYELSVVPRALFAADGSLLHAASKSDLMSILESLPKDIQVYDTPADSKSVAIIDGMADLQSLNKPEWISNCADLANHFIERHWQRYSEYDEVHLVFDRYDIGDSLKTSTREKRLGGHKAVAYHITDTTSIPRVSMHNLLAHTKTKDELTAYLAHKVLEHARIQGKNVVVAWRDHAEATHRQVELSSIQEEADTKLILHSLDATSNGATSIRIHSPDTDVLVLAIRRYPFFCQDTCFVTGVAQKHRVIQLQPIYNALGPNKAAALPGFHALSGADNTGRFAGKGKMTCWKVLQDLHADDKIVQALAQLGVAEKPSEDLITALEAFVCKLYLPNTELTNIADVRWYLFKKKQAQSEALPPTKAALLPAILRTHYQAMVWYNDVVANPELPKPLHYGWDLVDEHFQPVMTSLPPAPDAVIHLVKCSCAKTRCAKNQCICRKNGLHCTDLCNCCDDEPCENWKETILTDDEDESDEE